MYPLIAAILAITIFAGLVYQRDQAAFQDIQNASIAQMEAQSAIEMSAFATAAYTYTVNQGLAAGKSIATTDLITAHLLPANFAAVNPFGQTLQGVTGSGYNGGAGVLVYYTAAPTNMYGLPNVLQIQSSISFAIAQKLAAAQQAAPGFMAGVLTGAGYNSAQVPFGSAANAISLTQNFAGFTGTFPSAVDVINVMPNSGIVVASGVAGGAGTSGTCTPSTSTYSYTGSVQVVTPPAGCTNADVTLDGAGGGAASSFGNGGSGAKVTGIIPISSGEP